MEFLNTFLKALQKLTPYLFKMSFFSTSFKFDILVPISQTSIHVLILDFGTVLTIHSTYANILKNRYKKVRKNVGIGWIGQLLYKHDYR